MGLEVPSLTSLGLYLRKVLLLTDYITYHVSGCLWNYLAPGLGAPSGHGKGSCHPFFLSPLALSTVADTQFIFVE